jgi:hypothetical protein
VFDFGTVVAVGVEAWIPFVVLAQDVENAARLFVRFDLGD